MSADIIARLPTLHERTVAVERLLDRLVELESINKDLLEACKALKDEFSSIHDECMCAENYTCFWCTIDAIIAKAEGKKTNA